MLPWNGVSCTPVPVVGAVGWRVPFPTPAAWLAGAPMSVHPRGVESLDGSMFAVAVKRLGIFCRLPLAS